MATKKWNKTIRAIESKTNGGTSRDIAYAYAAEIGRYIFYFRDIKNAAWLGVTKLRMIDRFRKDGFKVNKPQPFDPSELDLHQIDSIIEKMAGVDYLPPQPIEEMHSHLCAAGYFFDQFGLDYPDSPITLRMESASMRLMNAVGQCIGLIYRLESREGTRTDKSRITKRVGADKKKSLVLKLDEQIDFKKTRNSAAEIIHKKWNDSDGKISVKRINDYLSEAGRRPPKTRDKK